MKARVLADDAAEGLWLRADAQSGGKGRLGRKWDSPKGNLYCSTIVDIRDGDPPPSSLSFVASLAVHATLRDYLSDRSIMLKWPNDAIVSDAKICGILLERVGDKVVLGIGINIASAPNLPDRKTTSIAVEAGSLSVSAAQCLDTLIAHFEAQLVRWRAEPLRGTLEQWLASAHPVGAPLNVTGPDGEKVSGAFAGLTDDGALRLSMADGGVTTFHAADIDLG